MSDEIIKRKKLSISSGLYRHDYCNMLVNHMAEGKSFASFCVTIGVPSTTAHNWVKEYEEFEEAYSLAKEASMAHWEEIAYDQAVGNHKGNASSLIFTLKNRFSDHYKDKQEIETSGNVVFQIDTGIKRDPDLIDIEAEVVHISNDEDCL